MASVANNIASGLSVGPAGNIINKNLGSTNAGIAQLLMGPLNPPTPISSSGPASHVVSPVLGQPNQNVPGSQGTPGYTYVNGQLTSVGGRPVGNTETTPTISQPAPSPSTTTTSANNTGSVATDNGNPYIAPIATAAQGNTPIGQNAASIASNYGQQIAQVGQNASIAEGALYTGGGPSSILQGNAATQAQVAAERESALASGEQAALLGTGQQLTAQQQEQQGLTSAGTLAQPQGTYPFVFNPSTGTFTNSGGGVMTPTQIATAINSGQMSPDQGLQAGSYLGSSAQSQIASAMQGINPNYNWNTGAASAAATASNVGTAGTATTSAYNSIYQQATTTGANYTTAQNNINSLGTNVLSLMANTPGINPTDSKLLNSKLNDLQTQFNSPEYANFNAQILALQRAVANYLQNGEIPTTATQGAQSIADGSVTVGALEGALKGVGSDLTSAIDAQKITAQYAKTQLGTSDTGSTQSSTSGSSTFSDESFYGGQ